MKKTFTATFGARCRVIFEALASPHFRAAFDFANFVQCGEDTEKCWELLRPYIEYIHIKGCRLSRQGRMCCAAQAKSKIKALLTRAIRRRRLRGFLTLEPHLVLFASLQSLETEDAANIIKEEQGERRRGRATPCSTTRSGEIPRRHLSCFPGGRSRF